MPQRGWSRRQFLRSALSTAAAASLLAACQGGVSPSPTPAATATAAVPVTPVATTAPAASASTPAATTSPKTTGTPALIRSRTLKMRVALATEEAGNFIAVDKGFFKEAGLNVDLVTTQGTPGEVIPLVAVGQLDLFSGAIQAALVNARTQGVEVTVVAGEGALRRGNVFHTYAISSKLANQGVRSIADLRGHTLAMPSDAGIDLLELAKVLETGKLTLNDVQLQLIRLPDMPVALQNGAVDAAELVEPYATIAIQQLKAATPLMPSDTIVDIVGDNFPISVIVAGPPMLKDRPLLEAFLTGYLKGVRYYLQSLQDGNTRAEVIQILKNRTPLKDDALYAQMTWPGVSADGTFDTAKLDQAQQLWKERGKVQQTIPAQQLVDFSYVQNAAKQL